MDQLTTYAELSQLSDKAWNKRLWWMVAAVPTSMGKYWCSSLQTAQFGTWLPALPFPNGMAVTPDNTTLLLAGESHGKRLTAFDIASDGSLSHPRVWADLGDGVPDGICLDAEGDVWYADVPNKRCGASEGGEVLQTIALDRGCFACMLGGEDRKTLFLVTREWHGMERPADDTQTGQVLTIEAPVAGAGWP